MLNFLYKIFDYLYIVFLILKKSFSLSFIIRLIDKQQNKTK